MNLINNLKIGGCLGAMKNLNRYLTTFSADYAGASNVVYEMEGLLIVHDPNSCAGHAYGIDEPRFFISPRPSFSTNIKEIEAITGNDQKQIQKIVYATDFFDVKFIPIIGSPVPALIGTDLNGIANSVEKKTNIPTVAIDTTGFDTYEKGVSKAYLSLAKKFTGSTYFTPDTCDVNIFGTVVTDNWDVDSVNYLKKKIHECGVEKIACWGADASLENITGANKSKLNIVVSVSGLEIAEYMKEKYNIPYICDFPVGNNAIQRLCERIREKINRERKSMRISSEKKNSIYKRILIINEQFQADGIRKCLLEDYAVEQVDCVSFFGWNLEMAQENDKKLLCEETLEAYIEENERYDLIIGDPVFRKVVECKADCYLEMPHLAVSTVINMYDSYQIIGEYGTKFFDYILEYGVEKEEC